MQTDREAESERGQQGGLGINPQTAASAERPLKPQQGARCTGGGTLSFPGPGPQGRAGRLTSAVGKRGTANCSSPATWICMAVSERWKTVRACAGRDHSPAGGLLPGAPRCLFPCSPPIVCSSSHIPDRGRAFLLAGLPLSPQPSLEPPRPPASCYSKCPAGTAWLGSL